MSEKTDKPNEGETPEAWAERRDRERREEITERIAVTVFILSNTSPKPLEPTEAFRRAEQFVAFALKRNPKAPLRSP